MVAANNDLSDRPRSIGVAMRDQTITIIKWMTGMLLAQGALIVALLQYLK